ncbi:MAG: hypothetical protein FJ011_04245 [Chloroflexi bacterium]|nr:hypothetical protein [Chloroflexota bacterium]
MIAVRAIYEQGQIKLLEPAPTMNKALAVVVFFDDRLGTAWPIVRKRDSEPIEWGEPIDEEGAQFLMAVHEELAPYRIEGEEAYLNREEA